MMDAPEDYLKITKKEEQVMAEPVRTESHDDDQEEAPVEEPATEAAPGEAVAVPTKRKRGKPGGRRHKNHGKGPQSQAQA